MISTFCDAQLKLHFFWNVIISQCFLAHSSTLVYSQQQLKDEDWWPGKLPCSLLGVRAHLFNQLKCYHVACELKNRTERNVTLHERWRLFVEAPRLPIASVPSSLNYLYEGFDIGVACWLTCRYNAIRAAKSPASTCIPNFKKRITLFTHCN